MAPLGAKNLYSGSIILVLEKLKRPDFGGEEAGLQLIWFNPTWQLRGQNVQKMGNFAVDDCQD